MEDDDDCDDEDPVKRRVRRILLLVWVEPSRDLLEICGVDGTSQDTSAEPSSKLWSPGESLAQAFPGAGGRDWAIAVVSEAVE